MLYLGPADGSTSHPFGGEKVTGKEFDLERSGGRFLSAPPKLTTRTASLADAFRWLHDAFGSYPLDFFHGHLLAPG